MGHMYVWLGREEKVHNCVVYMVGWSVCLGSVCVWLGRAEKGV